MGVLLFLLFLLFPSIIFLLFPLGVLLFSSATPYYHCMSRVVRKAFLCGIDISTGESYEHRRQWLEDKLLEIGAIFALDICAYAIMSNHYHVVLHINKTQADAWSNDEVIHK